MNDQLLCRLTAYLLLMSAAPAFAQTADEHAPHHTAPGASSQPATIPGGPSQLVQVVPVQPRWRLVALKSCRQRLGSVGGQPEAAPGGGMAAQMGEILKQMGTPPSKVVFPTLMALPDGMTTPTERAQI